MGIGFCRASVFGLAASLVMFVGSVQAEIKIGIAGPLSGGSTTGEQQDVGARKAVADINSNGGLLGQSIEIISADDACDPKQAEVAARLLVSEGVVFVNGHVCSGASIAASKIYEAAGIIMISPSSTNPKVTDEGGSNVFRVIGRDDQQGIVAGNYLAKYHANSKIAIIHDNQAYGLGLAEFTRQQLNKRGVNEVIFDSYTAGESDYTSIVDKLVNANVDVLYVGGYQADTGIIIRQVKQRIPNLLLVSGDSLVNAEFLDIAGEASEGSMFTFGPDIRLKPEAKIIAAAIRDEEAFEPSGFTLYSYGAVQAWAQAVQQAGSLKPDEVINALKTGSFDTALGKIKFDEKGDVTGLSSFVLYVYRKEDYVLAE